MTSIDDGACPCLHLGPRCYPSQAEAEAERLNAAFEALAEAALADGGAGDDADAAGDTAEASGAPSEAAAVGDVEAKIELLRRAEAAEQVG
jgi:hypothetical protein